MTANRQQTEGQIPIFQNLHVCSLSTMMLSIYSSAGKGLFTWLFLIVLGCCVVTSPSHNTLWQQGLKFCPSFFLKVGFAALGMGIFERTMKHRVPQPTEGSLHPVQLTEQHTSSEGCGQLKIHTNLIFWLFQTNLRNVGGQHVTQAIIGRTQGCIMQG